MKYHIAKRHATSVYTKYLTMVQLIICMQLLIFYCPLQEPSPHTVHCRVHSKSLPHILHIAESNPRAFPTYCTLQSSFQEPSPHTAHCGVHSKSLPHILHIAEFTPRAFPTYCTLWSSLQEPSPHTAHCGVHSKSLPHILHIAEFTPRAFPTYCTLLTIFQPITFFRHHFAFIALPIVNLLVQQFDTCMCAGQLPRLTDVISIETGFPAISL